MKRTVLVGISLYGILLVGCAGEFASYQYAKQGNAAYTASNYKLALQEWQTGLNHAREIGDQKAAGTFLYNIGIAYEKLEEYSRASASYNEALQLRQALGDTLGQADILNNIGIMHSSRGRYADALSAYQHALNFLKNKNDTRRSANLLNNLGAAHWNLGEFDQALDYYQQALRLKKSLNDPVGVGNSVNNIGGVYESRGQYQLALEQYQQALTLRRNSGDQRGEAKTLNNLGVVYWKIGRDGEALKYYSDALNLCRQIREHAAEASTLHNIGVIYAKHGEYQKASAQYNQALSIRKRLGDSRGEGSTLTSLGAVYEARKEYRQASQYYQAALHIRQTIGDKRGEGFTLARLGENLRKLGQYPQAEKAYAQSIEINRTIGTLDALWIAQRGLAGVETRTQRYQAAVTHYEHALETIESLRAGVTSEEDQLAFMEDKRYVYDELIELLALLHSSFPHKGYDRKALEIFERKQGRLFLEEIGKSGARRFAGLPQAVKLREEELDTQIERIRQRITEEYAKTAPAYEQLQPLQKQYVTLAQSRRTFEELLKFEYPDYYDLRYPHPASLRDLQQQVLRPGELLLAFQVMKRQTLLWTITADNMQMHALPIHEADLQLQIEQLRETMLNEWTSSVGLTASASSSPSSEQLSNTLYQQLFPGAVHSLIAQNAHVHIVPTGPLYLLPFEALVTRRGKATHYFLEDAAVSYLSSASLLKTLREAKSRRDSTARYPILTFANPVYRDENDSENNANSVRSLRKQTYQTLLSEGIVELPETEEEARSVIAVFNPPAPSQPLQIRRAASRANILAMNEREQLDDYQHLLFSMHGVMPNEVDNLMQSALILSDDFLTTADVFGLRCNANLIALSACNTGRGKEIRGEGIIGLTRAFMYAGTSTVAVTLWSVESMSAKALSVGMFSHLQKGKTPGEALRAIKLHMLRGKGRQDFRHPFYWSPFVIFGDGV